MEYCAQGDLETFHLKKGPFNDDVAISFLRQIV